MRRFIQSKLNEIKNIEIGAEVTDDMLETGTTYFSYSLYYPYSNTDYENNYTYRVSCIGFVKRLIQSNENTLDIVDKATEDIVNKLRELNIRCSYEDVSIANNVQKIKITGEGLFNEINNTLV